MLIVRGFSGSSGFLGWRGVDVHVLITVLSDMLLVLQLQLELSQKLLGIVKIIRRMKMMLLYQVFSAIQIAPK